MQALDHIANQLQQFVQAVVGDPVYRRLLRRRPAEALALAGLPAEQALGELPVQHYRVSVYLDYETLFGIPAVPPATSDVPLEARLVLYGAKPLALVHGPELAMSGLAAWARTRRLSALMSPKEFTPVEDPDKAGYANLAADMRPAQAGSGAWRGLLLAQDSAQAMLGWCALLFGWDEFLGHLLGYPECCVAAFAKNWARLRDEHRGDGARVLVEGSDPTRLYGRGANIFVRYFGIRAVEHFPCSLDCAATQALAERTLNVLAQFEPDQARDAAGMLESTVLFTDEDGIFILRDARFESNDRATVCHYDPARVVASTASSRTAELLRLTSRLEVDAAGVTAAGASFAGRLLRFAAAGGA
jgi:hypothetical protein